MARIVPLDRRAAHPVREGTPYPRDLVYHLHRIDSCGISVAQALEVLDEVTLWVILADLFK
jgi:hypothetical protein